MRAVCWIRTTCSPAAVTVAQRVRAAGEGPVSRHSWDRAAACSANWPPGCYRAWRCTPPPCPLHLTWYFIIRRTGPKAAGWPCMQLRLNIANKLGGCGEQAGRGWEGLGGASSARRHGDDVAMRRGTCMSNSGLVLYADASGNGSRGSGFVADPHAAAVPNINIPA